MLPALPDVLSVLWASCGIPVSLTSPHAVCCGGLFVARMLERWLCEGVLQDSRGEFMVMEDKVSTAL